MTDAIGGYFSLELPQKGERYMNAIRLNTGRNCLEYILRAQKYHKVYIPYYTCDAVLEPFQKLDIQYEFYHIDINLEIRDFLSLKDDEGLLYTNYYGLKQQYVEKLAEDIGSNLIIDNTQAFYAKRIDGIDTFYTCRKFFGVPDGAYLYTDVRIGEDFEQDQSYDRFAHLLKRIDVSAEDGFVDFHHTEECLDDAPIRKMSKLTQCIMQSIDYDNVAKIRRENYDYLSKALCRYNEYDVPLDDDAVPMVYPFLTFREDLREKLIRNKIFVARYWPNVLEWAMEDDIEYKLVNHLLPLPIDQRYGTKEMDCIIDIILEKNEK